MRIDAVMGSPYGSSTHRTRDEIQLALNLFSSDEIVIDSIVVTSCGSGGNGDRVWVWILVEEVRNRNSCCWAPLPDEPNEALPPTKHRLIAIGRHCHCHWGQVLPLPAPAT